jgi:membrane protease YdiL (CAAX protease family)
MKASTKRGLRLGALCFLGYLGAQGLGALVITVAVTIIFHFLGLNTTVHFGLLEQWVLLGTAVLSTVGMLGLHAVRKKSVLAAADELELGPVKPVTVLLAVVAGFAAWAVIAFGLPLIPFPASWGAQLENAFREASKAPLWLQLLSMGIFVPINEEIYLRGGVMNSLRRGLSPVVAIFASGLLFGAMHGIPLQIFYASIIGILLGVALHCTKSLMPCIIMHIVINSWDSLCSYVPGFDNFTNRNAEGWRARALVLAGAAVLAACLLLMRRAQKDMTYRKLENEMRAPKRKKAQAQEAQP